MLRVVSTPGRPLPGYLSTSRRVKWGEGFYGREWDGDDHFRWMGPRGRLEFEPADEPRYLELTVLSEFADLSQELTVRAPGSSSTFPLTKGWMQVSVPVPPATNRVDLEANKLFPRRFYPDDSRGLAVRVRAVRLHADAARHEHVARQHRNACDNTREMLAGAVELASTPPSLGIDMYGVCNVKPPCVYCEWDQAKELEGANVDAPFTTETLRQYGAFFDNAHNLTNCSIGEPFMMKNFDDLLEVFGRQGKVLELTTNGQILTDRNIERLLGRAIDLYVSLDAASAETYARLRNDAWERILANLRRLIEARKSSGGLPRIHLVFMPMRANLHELGDFVELCADLGADRLVLRPLNYSEWIDLEWDRNGYHFVYRDELLPFDQLVAASVRAAALCRRHGVALSDQMDFGSQSGFVREFEGESDEIPAPEETPAASAAPADPVPATEPDAGSPRRDEPPVAGTVEASQDGTSEPPPAAAVPDSEAPEPSLGDELQPICTEPWKKLYILRRGVLPCSYGSPLGPMQDYRRIWNSPEMQEIRRELAAGRFPRYCLDASCCPIVRRSIHGHRLPWRQALFLRVRSAWQHFDRATREGWPARLAWPAKAAVGLGLEAWRDPSAAARRVGRKLHLVRGD